VWITKNIFKKYIDGRTHWMDYPDDIINPKDTSKEVYMLNNPEGVAPAKVQFIGFLNDRQLIGSSYDRFTISEASLYPGGAFQFLRPIWDRKLALGTSLSVNFNGTPRGIKNVMYDMMRVYSGVDDPDEFPGEHIMPGGNCYIDKVTIKDLMIPDGHGDWKHMYEEEDIEILKSQYQREFGNLNFYMQENECDFTTVNAGLVYLAIEDLLKENRYTPHNLDSSKPVYTAWDIASKGKMTDATSGIVFQYYGDTMFIYDIFEARGKSFVECVTELSERPYFHSIRFGALPWDSERSASSDTPIEEARKMFPNITWHALGQERVDRGIQLVRKQLPNTIINSDKCDWFLTCVMNYEYKRLEKADDWSAKPKKTVHSHLMDAWRYGVMAMNEIQYLQLNNIGADPDVADHYIGCDDDEFEEKASTMRKRRKEVDDGIYYG
jgi:hypothetical protein